MARTDPIIDLRCYEQLDYKSDGIEEVIRHQITQLSGYYSYDWPEEKPNAEERTFQQLLWMLRSDVAHLGGWMPPGTSTPDREYDAEKLRMYVYSFITDMALVMRHYERQILMAHEMFQRVYGFYLVHANVHVGNCTLPELQAHAVLTHIYVTMRNDYNELMGNYLTLMNQPWGDEKFDHLMGLYVCLSDNEPLYSFAHIIFQH